MKAFGAISHLVRLTCIVFTILLAMALILAAYGGRTDPSHGTIYALATLAFPYVFIVALTAALAWIVAGRWKVSLIIVAAGFLSWPTVRIVCPINFGSSLKQKPAPLAGRDTLGFKVLSFNVMHFNVQAVGDDNEHNIRGQATVRYILQQDADVVLLQEASLHADFNDLTLMKPYIKELSQKYPYRDHGWHDQVILSKHPYTKVEDAAIRDGFGAPDDPQQSFLFYARAFDVLVPGHTVRFINVHLQSIHLSDSDKETYKEITSMNIKDSRQTLSQVRHSVVSKLGDAFRLRAAQAATVRQIIDQSGENVIVCGDFNDTPASWAYNTIVGRDLRDAWTDCGFGMTYTYHENRLWFKIDHVLYRGDMQATSIQRHREGSSDHYPLVATFRWNR